MLDNLAVHKQPGVRTAIEHAGARLRFLPPYSPDFNPIEQAFAKLKAFLRAARPRSFDDVCALMRTALALFLPDQCTNYVSTADTVLLHRIKKRFRPRARARPKTLVCGRATATRCSWNTYSTRLVDKFI